MIRKWEDNSEELKLIEEKRKEMNNLIGLNNITVKNKPTLLISDWCAEHIKTLHKEYPNTEWLAYCKVQPQGNGIFLMTDMVFPWQKTTGGDVETTELWMKWLTSELIRRWEKLTEWNCVLHSHHHMGCFWSGTDDNARKSLNDWRQLAWAVVTAYADDWIHYKGCLNFYKPYNIEIDAIVENAEERSIVDRYNDYLKRVAESEATFYDFLLEENKEYIDSITDKPSYSNLLDYLGIDITKELNENYDKLKDRIWNPELLEYYKQMNTLANQLATTEVNGSGEYKDTLLEYGAFCEWSDNLLTQLETNKEKITYGTQTQLISQTAFPLNRDFEDEYEDEYYYFTSPDFTEPQVRQTMWIDITIPMRVGKHNEWQAWSNYTWRYEYVEDWAELMWG